LHDRHPTHRLGYETGEVGKVQQIAFFFFFLEIILIIFGARCHHTMLSKIGTERNSPLAKRAFGTVALELDEAVLVHGIVVLHKLFTSRPSRYCYT